MFFNADDDDNDFMSTSGVDSKYVQPNNYATFYDDPRQNWSIMFDTEQSALQFAKQVTIAMACSMGSSFNTLLSQDLVLGEGGSLESGDNVEVKYTGWLFTNNTIGQEFDSNVNADKLFRFKIGKGKVIKGWDTGVIGMKKGSKRLLVVPPSLGYGSQGAGSKIPPNATLIFEIEVIREGSKSGKAKLISRMAKMGKPMLPLVGAVPAQPSDEEDNGEHEVVAESPQPVVENPGQPVLQTTQGFTKPVPQHPVVQPQVQPNIATMAQPVVNPQPAFLQNIPAAQQLSLYQSPQTLLQQQQAALLQQQQQQLQQQQQAAFQTPGFPGQPNTLNPQFPQQQFPETRQQNTEIRLTLGKVSDKVDKVLEKMDHINSQHNSSLSLHSTQPNMEASVLMHNIQRIVQENDRLRTEVYEKSSKIEMQNNKISELLQNNQISQAKVLALEQEKVQLATELADVTSQLKDEERISQLTKSLKEEKQKRKSIESKMSQIQEEFTDLKSANESLEKEGSKSGKAKLISRMAKMGKPMLPLVGAVPAQPSDEEDNGEHEVVAESPQPVVENPGQPVLQTTQGFTKPVPQHPVVQPQVQPNIATMAQPVVNPQPAFLQNIPAAQQLSLYQSPQTLLQQQQAALLQQQQQQLQQQQQAAFQTPGFPGQPNTLNPQFPQQQFPETRQQNTEIRLTLGKVSDKVDKVLEKENDRLRTEVYEKSSKIEMQNNKISELLQNNQISQAKVLALEQEKVQLATELADVTSQLSNLQLEIAGIRKKEMELQQTLNTSTQDSKNKKEELESLQAQHTEDEERISQLTKSLKEEKQKRKSIESKMSQIQEEFTDLKSANESLEKQEIQSLRDKLRKQKSSTDVMKAEQVSHVEEELNKEWKDKCERLLATAQEKHNRAIQDIKEEKEELENKVQELENKILSVKNSGGGYETKIQELQEEIEELSVWKNKYENLRNQATTMKEKYEEQISDLEEERDQMEEEKDKVTEMLQKLKQEKEVKVPSGGLDSQSLAAEIKKIMNQVYQTLRSQFDGNSTYTGTFVLGAILNVIKETTLKLVKQPAGDSSKPDEEGHTRDFDFQISYYYKVRIKSLHWLIYHKELFDFVGHVTIEIQMTLKSRSLNRFNFFQILFTIKYLSIESNLSE
ncbi:LOW QUALITY PROTEIN: hypothetical protein KUTeg_022095 [Tegillarca granosa]|uniref:peptidylprolyl isomerase n=1 Tax=Tegillarca granosa TaxID=220873 RepID=A0ABQ9E581_TEGGR|nr:LOW QUALITY PROTEIN: hypothetical protein KUTeg_022095 [Tegillarca granosa]